MTPGFVETESVGHQFVLLDVGGRCFKVWTRTLRRYPESLLVKMLREFPESVVSDEAIYVDRNPKYFEWILEIYRDGDYNCCIPEAPEEQLQKELDFYQLPSLRELDICPRGNSKTDCRLRSIVDDIIAEINQRGFYRFFPIEVYLYYKYTKDISFDGQRIFLRCPSHVGRIVNPPDEEHGALYSALWGRQTVYTWESPSMLSPMASRCSEYPGYVTIDALGESLLIKRFDETELKHAKREAWKHGLRVDCRSSRHAIGGRIVDLDYLYVMQL